MPIRRSIAVFWIHRKASASLIFSFFMSTPLARSTALRVSRRSPRSATSDSSALSSAQRDRATSIAGVTSPAVKGLTT